MLVSCRRQHLGICGGRISWKGPGLSRGVGIGGLFVDDGIGFVPEPPFPLAEPEVVGGRRRPSQDGEGRCQRRELAHGVLLCGG